MASKIAGIVFIVAGAIGFIVFLATSIFGIFAGFERIEAPGGRTLELEAGAYTVYWETPSMFKPMAGPDGLRVSVSRDGAELPLDASGLMRSRYSTGSRAGVSIHGFTAPAKGLYTVTAKFDLFNSDTEGDLAVGRSVGFLGVLKIVLGCVALLGIGVGGGVFLIVRSLKTTPPPPSR